RAARRQRWPGEAAVIVASLNILKGQYSGAKILNGKLAARISPYLIASTIDDDPTHLRASSGVAFLGSKVQAIGFVFDDTNPKCPPEDLAREMLQTDERYTAIIKPYVGGEELTDRPIPDFPRFVVDFDDMSEQEAATFKDPFELVKRFVYPERM